VTGGPHRVVVLAGGVGGSRFTRGVRAALRARGIPQSQFSTLGFGESIFVRTVAAPPIDAEF